jgi:hypothetical protein
VFHDRSKHIDVRYHYIKECVKRGRIIIDYTATEVQIADVLIKALGHVTLRSCAPGLASRTFQVI